MNAEESRQCVMDITNWFSQFETQKPDFTAENRSYQKIEKMLDRNLPPSVVQLLSDFDIVYFYEKKVMQVAEICKFYNEASDNKSWSPSYLPFCQGYLILFEIFIIYIYISYIRYLQHTYY